METLTSCAILTKVLILKGIDFSWPADEIQARKWSSQVDCNLLLIRNCRKETWKNSGFERIWTCGASKILVGHYYQLRYRDTHWEASFKGFSFPINNSNHNFFKINLIWAADENQAKKWSLQVDCNLSNCRKEASNTSYILVGCNNTNWPRRQNSIQKLGTSHLFSNVKKKRFWTRVIVGVPSIITKSFIW